ncbi:hypothetical protein [Microbacterium enclense]|uniref:hypothetical protein n=1 Tax=Microbacterium enclense TaxID=993073 RepID=UPI003D710E2E
MTTPPARPARSRLLAAAVLALSVTVASPAVAHAASATPEPRTTVPAPTSSASATPTASPEAEAEADAVDAELLPPEPRIVGVAVGDGTASGDLLLLNDLFPDDYPGPFAPIESVEVAAVSADGSITRTRMLDGVESFDFDGLPPGLYTATATTVAGSGASVTGELVAFVIPTTPLPASLYLFTATDTLAVLRVSGGVNQPDDVPSGATAADFEYSLTVTGGGETFTTTRSGWPPAPNTVSTVEFPGLTPGTDYEVTVTVTNAVGTGAPTFLPFTTAAGPVEATAPGEWRLTDDTRGGLRILSPTISSGSEVTLQIDGAFVGRTVQGWLSPGGVSLGARSADEAGRVWFTLPADLSPGVYRIAVTGPGNADGVIGWAEFTIPAPAAVSPSAEPTASPAPTAGVSSLARTGGESPAAALLAGGVLAPAGTAFIALHRRRRV